MKIRNFINTIAMLFLFTFAGQVAEAQILKKIKEKVSNTAEDKVLNKTGEVTDKGMDKSAENVTKKKKEKQDEVNGPSLTGNTEQESKGSLISYANYDFVPGDKIIYHYDMSGEKDAEIPGRIMIDGGNVEIQTYKGEKVLFIPAGERVYLSPMMKEKSYLPRQFTVEFDMLSNGFSNTDASEITLYFREKDDVVGTYGSATAPIKISLSAISGKDQNPQYGFMVYKNDGDEVGGGHRNFPSQAVDAKQDNWRRAAIYVNENIGKLFMDQHRIGMINQIQPERAAKLDIEVNSQEHPVMFRNFRIAAGGADSYNKIITEGKFIAYGIRFDVNKSVLKPESMGTINEFVKMMKENPSLNFEIGGHTDSDGTSERNLTLSQERADMVKKQMTSMGIDAGRLTTRGYGSSQSIADNSSAENKAKNRRVEFVKKP